MPVTHIDRVTDPQAILSLTEYIKKENLLPFLTPFEVASIPHFVAINDEGKIQGVMGLGRSTWFSTEFMHLMVLPEYRRQGVGKVLVDFATEYAKNALSKKVLTCTVRANNDGCNNLLFSKGFTIASKFMNGENKINYLIKGLSEVD